MIRARTEYSGASGGNIQISTHGNDSSFPNHTFIKLQGGQFPEVRFEAFSGKDDDYVRLTFNGDWEFNDLLLAMVRHYFQLKDPSTLTGDIVKRYC